MRFLSILLLLLALLPSCQRIDAPKDYQSNFIDDFYQPRNPEIPMIDYNRFSKPMLERMNNSATDMQFVGWLGRSVKLNTLPAESMENLQYQIIDINRYYQDYPNSISINPISHTTYDINTFSSLEHYYENSSYNNSVSADVEIDFGSIFNLAASFDFSESFNISTTSMNEYIFGISDFNILENKYSLSVADNDLRIIKNEYLNDSFIQNIFFSTPVSVINNYGEFVIRQFITGGSLEILYAAHKSTNSASTTTNEEYQFELETAIMSMINGEVEHQISGRDSIYNYDLFSDVRVSYKFLGGDALMSSFSLPENAETFVLNTTFWENSMQDPDNHVISKYIDNSLIPIYTFIEEDNLKNKYRNIISGQGITLQALMVPNIKIAVTEYSLQKNMKLCQSYITTRFGDRILLNSIDVPESLVRNVVGTEFQRLQGIFPDIEIISYNDYQTGRPGLNLNNFQGCEFDINSLTKYVDSNSGKTYLLTTIQSTGRKVAYVLYNEDIINEYTFDDIIEQVPNTDKSLHVIKTQYELIAL